jgi:hypothetical protein
MPLRRNPERSTRSPEIVRDISESEEGEYGEDNDDGFHLSNQERGCPTCRNVPTNTLRIFPDVFRCPVCMTEDETHVYVFLPCGHCLCNDCKQRWIPDSIHVPLPDVANLNIADQSPASGRRGRPVMSPQARGPDSTRRRKQAIITAIENREFNNAIVMDTIFYCDIPETFNSPDQEPREVFRQRLANAMNTEENGNNGEEDNSWVHALHRVSVHFEGDNPLEIVNYTLTMLYGGINLTLTLPLVKGLKRCDIIGCITKSDYDNSLVIGALPTRDECIAYFASNKNETIIDEGTELIDIYQ